MSPRASVSRYRFPALATSTLPRSVAAMMDGGGAGMVRGAELAVMRGPPGRGSSYRAPPRPVASTQAAHDSLATTLQTDVMRLIGRGARRRRVVDDPTASIAA